MARVDVLELKSFQKISLNEVRNLGEMDFKKNQQSRAEEAQKQTVSMKVVGFENNIKAKFQAVTRLIKLALHNLLYETVSQCDTYSPE
ncbi:hypothetical protein BH11CYA1_BH11CYA1_14510 [soil metagenome]